MDVQDNPNLTNAQGNLAASEAGNKLVVMDSQDGSSSLNEPNDLLPTERVVDFMLAEYTMLRDLRQDVVSNGESRLNFFLATVSGALVGLALLKQISGYGDIITLVNGIILIGLFLLGLNIYARLIERTIRVVVYTRGLNCIRNYFSEHYIGIKRYLVLPIRDDYPNFTAVGDLSKGAFLIDLPGAVAIINSIIASSGLAFSISINLALSINQVALIAMLAFCLVFASQYIWFITRIKAKQKETQVRFPESK